MQVHASKHAGYFRENRSIKIADLHSPYLLDIYVSQGCQVIIIIIKY
jgi:hypothetical protein